MHRTLTSATALGFAFALPVAALAQDADQQAFTDAGFTNVQMMSEVEVARVEAEDGTTFFVVSGLDGGMSTMGMATDGMGASSGMTTTGGASTETTAMTTGQSGTDTTAGATGTTGTGADTGAAGTAVTGGAAGGTEMADTDTDTDTDTDNGAETMETGSSPQAGMDAAGSAGTTTMSTDIPATAGSGSMAGGSDSMAGGGQSLEEQLTAAGISNYEILSDARIGQVTSEGGGTMYVVNGLDDN